jgi:RNA polymerase sigma-70 factor (ECF subfamily)
LRHIGACRLNPNGLRQRVDCVVDALFIGQRSASRRGWRLGVNVPTLDDEFERFFLANYDAVLRVLVVTTGDRERAIDATQEAFIRAYARWSKIRSYESPAGWVRRVALNASRDSFRSDRRRRSREEASPEVNETPHSDRYHTESSALEMLALLPDRQRVVATLFYIDDRSVAEIASILQVNEGTVKSHLSSARERLRSAFDQNEAPT